MIKLKLQLSAWAAYPCSSGSEDSSITTVTMLILSYFREPYSKPPALLFQEL